MCLIAFALNSHPDYRLILAGNRDEFYERPTSYADFWKEESHVLAGKDLQGGGTWLGVNSFGKVSAVTNYRDPTNINPQAKTRGDLTRDYLVKKEHSAMIDMKRIAKEASLYNGFNVLMIEESNGYHFSNYEKKINKLDTGIYGLSNALIDTPWPKLSKLKSDFAETIEGSFSHEDLLNILNDKEQAPDDQLPSTGIPYEWEKAISSICIELENYGTCCSTVVTIDHDGVLNFTERSFPVGNREQKVVSFSFKIENP